MEVVREIQSQSALLLAWKDLGAICEGPMEGTLSEVSLPRNS